MGAAISRVARLASPRTAKIPEEVVRQAVSAQELQRQARIQEALRHLPVEEGKNEQLVSDMNKLMTAIGMRQVKLYKNPEMDKLYAKKKKSQEEKEAELIGRLTTVSVKALYDDRIRAWQQGGELSADELAREYGANPEVLRRVLQYNSVPAVTQAPDGRLIGRWPE